MTRTPPPLSYAERSKHCLNPCAKKLFECMERKQSNLAISADVTRAKELISLAKTLAPHICVFKTHIDIVEDFSFEIAQELRVLADASDFLIFEDRKFADIGNTVALQYEKGIYRIAEWAHITNAHPLPGIGVIEGLQRIGLPRHNGLLLLAEMSSKNNLFSEQYTQTTVNWAKQYPEFVMGFISQRRLLTEPHFVHMTPGVHCAKDTDTLDQQYSDPHTVIFEKESDVIIVGRGIYGAENCLSTAKTYQEAGWQAYQQRLRK